MRKGRMALIPVTCALIAGCGGADLTCDDVERYQLAQGGPRIAVPEDLDELEASKENTIPRSSPRESRAEGSPCLDLPPRVKVKKQG